MTTNVRHADETALIVEPNEKLQTLMNLLAEASNNMGPEINTQKETHDIHQKNTNPFTLVMPWKIMVIS